MSGNIRVVCRFRPQNSKEIKAKGKVVVEFLDDQTVHLNGSETDHKFTFDKIFVPTASQKEVYDSTALVVIKDIFNGYNGTIFVYGQTSSGKTHTMMGPDGGKGMDDPSMKGIIPRMVSTIFDQVENADENLEFLVCVSYIEIYMEKIRDLLNPSNDNLPVRENKQRGIYVEGATEISVASEEDVMSVMRTGQSNRSVGFTKMNAESSRSHSLFVVNITQKDVRTGTKRNGKLYLVDLAGSEKVGKTGAQGTTLDEAKMINKSLSALGNVINALTDGKSKHIPYRDSKLTRVLQESIGGNSRTTLIVNSSPDSSNEMETLSTLRFGTRAKSIKNKAKVNEERSVGEWKIICTKLQQELQRSRKYIGTLESELGIVKNGGKSTLAIKSLSKDVSSSAPSVNQPTTSNGTAIKELHDQISELEKKLGDREELIDAAEEAKNILKDQITEKQFDYDQIQAELHIAQESLANQQKIENELKEEQKNLIAQIASKDIEVETFQKSTEEKLTLVEQLQQQNNKLNEENTILTGKLMEVSNKRKRSRSLSLQKINKERSNWTHKEEEIENNLSRSLQKIIIPTDKEFSSEDSSSLNQAISDTKDHLAEFKEFQIILLEDWKQRSKALVQLQEYIEDVATEFEKLQNCDMYSLQEKNLVLSTQLEKLQDSQLNALKENNTLSIQIKVAEEKLSARDIRIQELEAQLTSEKELRISQDKQYAKQFEDFARQIEQQKKQRSTIVQQGVKTMRGGGGKRKVEEPKKTSWFGSFFAPSPKRPEASQLEMSPTNAFDTE